MNIPPLCNYPHRQQFVVKCFFPSLHKVVKRWCLTLYVRFGSQHYLYCIQLSRTFYLFTFYHRDLVKLRHGRGLFVV